MNRMTTAAEVKNPWVSHLAARIGLREAVAELELMDQKDVEEPRRECNCGGQVWFRPGVSAAQCWSCKKVDRQMGMGSER